MEKKSSASYNTSMIYIIKGEEKKLIKDKLKEFTNGERKSLVKIDGQGSNFTISKMIDTCKQIDLFSDFNIVLVKDAPFLIDKYEGKDIDILINYLNNPLYECDLIFYTLDNLYNEKLKLFKQVANNALVLRYERFKKGDFYNYCKKALNEANIKLDYEANNYLIENSFPDLDLFNRNLEILKLYPETLDIFALKALVTTKDEQDVFKLINAIMAKNVSQSLKLVKKYLKYDDNVLGLLALLANQLRLLYSIAYYQSIGKSKKEIEEILNINPYRLQKAYEVISNFDMKEIMSLLNKLADLEYTIKVDSSLDDKLRTELFILELL